jgi:hypothetical protein
MSSLRDWKGYNEALVKRGLILLDLGFVAGWSRELKAMNQRKEGARYRYPESFVKLLQLGNAEWRKERGYGYRWMAESAFSSLKRVFGEHITSVRWRNIVNEAVA